MCVAGLYFVFLLLEDVIVAYYLTDAASQDQDMNFKIAYDILRSDVAKYQNKHTIKEIDSKMKLQAIFNTSTTTGQPRKKVHMERVTRKQYEIINMLWRKTKIFMDEDEVYTTKPNFRRNFTKIMSRRSHKDLIKLTTTAPTFQTSTPSNIEFYYLDDTQLHTKEKKCTESNCKQTTETLLNSNSAKVNSKPFFVFHIKGPYAKLQLTKSHKSLSSYPKLVNETPKVSGIRTNNSMKVKQQAAMELNSLKFKLRNEEERTSREIFSRDDHLFYDTILAEPVIIKSSFHSGHINVGNKTSSIINKNRLEATTTYDKIKFFELYDQNTRPPKVKDVKRPTDSSMDYNDETETTIQNQKILLEHVDQSSHDHKEAKISKKHITESDQKLYNIRDKKTDNKATKIKTNPISVVPKKQTNDLYFVSNVNLTTSMPSNYNTGFSYMYENATWSEYPFTAVYIYEPLKVHCDAAGISAYWLVASGSCLSRIQKNPNGGGRSAFVAYCGEQWWRPERVAYVKYTLVHPLYHSRDKTRRHIYNIGVIQVVTSMRSACTGWAPVSLMSHQFAAAAKGSWASAVGWGVDRFDTRYAAADLPKTPLMVYKGLVYFDSCPGNIGYSKAKRLDDGGGVRNVHCMGLPPYSGEEKDPVHGGLLLVGGKLIALYLQEERRPWGEQSAQYTGVWRLIPWVMEVAKEPDDKDTFIFEI